jgi:hypothetical protein
MPHPQESIDQSEAGQVDEGYFVLALSIHKCLQQLPREMV